MTLNDIFYPEAKKASPAAKPVNGKTAAEPGTAARKQAPKKKGKTDGEKQGRGAGPFYLDS